MNGIFLNLLIKEIKPQIIQARIKSIFQADRLVYMNLNKGQLVISLVPEAIGIYLNQFRVETCKMARRFRYLEGRIIEDVLQDGFSPVVKIKIRSHQEYFVTIVLIRNLEDVRIITDDGKIGSLFKKEEASGRQKMRPDEIETHFLKSLLDKKEPIRALIDNIEGIDRFLAREIVEDPARFEKLKKILTGSKFSVNIVSIKPLRLSFFQNNIEHFATFNETYQIGIESYLKKIVEEEKERKRQAELKKLVALESELEKELAEAKKAEKFRIKGEAILANIRDIKPAQKKIMLPNPYRAEEKLEILLNPNLRPEINAQGYFGKYKKLKRKIIPLEIRLAKIGKKIMDLKDGILVLDDDIKAISKRDIKVTSEHFRRFVTRGGFEVLVGKDARTNDELTFKVARPFDIFFHTRGVAGSHTILRTAKRKPSRYDLYEAAAIAAYFSKARNAKRVAVSYTERKYLKKNKKGPPGLVILMREEVIFVDPALPRAVIEKG